MRLLKTTPVYIGIAAICIFFLTRLGLIGFAWAKEGLQAAPLGFLPRILGKGLLFDLATAAYVVIPLVVYECLIPNRWRASRTHMGLRFLATALVVGILIFGAVSEFTFWLEFSTRLNFIAVDYLIYTKEVIGNIRESYPVGLIFAGIGLLAVGVTWRLWKHIRFSDSTPYSWKEKFAQAALMLFVIPVGVTASISVENMEGSGNTYVDELSGNGVFTFAAALRRNELDYDKFYATIDDAVAEKSLLDNGVTRQRASLAKVPPTGHVATADASLPYFMGKPKNVVLVSIESFSASFVGAHGNKQGLTPFIDALSKDGLMFSELYATGTRTVRGLEALSLGAPPIPGQAIVRRPNNEHLTTIGQLLRGEGYDTHFVYGGYGYFDNMNAYFAANDYTVTDRTDIPAEDVAFENAWGVADETLFNQTIRVIDKAQKTNGKPFFVHVMTTSNHRPFTYPDGRIDIPSPGGREGAVKYTDYAVGKFIADAKSKPWFKDTLFVITADHCASVAGKSKLPIQNYHIPMVFYGPSLVKPGVFSRMVSQIDIAPTLLQVLGQPGQELFFGQSMFAQQQTPRVFVSNYQELGYFKNDVLTVLSPRRKIDAYAIDADTFAASDKAIDESLKNETIAFYQTASRAFKKGQLKAPVQIPAGGSRKP